MTTRNVLTELRATVEGPGSVPFRMGSLLGRGMLNRGAELAKLGSYVAVESEDVALFVVHDRVPPGCAGARVQVGAPDMAAANTVRPSDPEYLVAKRLPVDDGLITMLVLEGGPDA